MRKLIVVENELDLAAVSRSMTFIVSTLGTAIRSRASRWRKCFFAKRFLCRTNNGTYKSWTPSAG